jgi:hypothetical protein
VKGKQMQDQKSRSLAKNRYYLGTKIKCQLRGASYSVPCKQRDAAPKEKEGLHEKKEATLMRRSLLRLMVRQKGDTR